MPVKKRPNTGSFKKGQSGNPAGRTAGVPNKATANAREAFARLVDGNVERVQDWLDQIAVADGPRAALQCFLDMAEFHVPKLARTEFTGPEGSGLKRLVIEWQDESPNA